MPGPALTVQIKGDTADLDAALNKASGGFKGFASGIVAGFGGPIGILTSATTALVDMGRAAGEDAAEQAKLAKTFENAGAAVGDYQAKIDDAIAKGQERAFTDSEQREALGKLVTRTGDVEAATAALATAQDLARLGGTDLATATDAVGKALDGSYRSLQQFGIQIDSGTESIDALRLVQQAAAGQADLYATSQEGMAARAGQGLDELGETVGTALLPALDSMSTALIPIVEKLAELAEKVIPLLTPVLELLGTAFGVVVDLLIKAIDLVLPVITPLVDALGIALGLVGDAFTAIQDAIELLMPVLSGLYGLADTLITSVLDVLKAVLDAIAGAFDAVVTAIDAAMQPIRDIMDLIGDALESVQGFLDTLANVANVQMPGFRFPWEQGGAFGGPEGMRTTGGSGTFGRGMVTVNTGADPGAVVRAIRRYTAANGGPREFGRLATGRRGH